jgi:hypothetical protein
VIASWHWSLVPKAIESFKPTKPKAMVSPLATVTAFDSVTVVDVAFVTVVPVGIAEVVVLSVTDAPVLSPLGNEPDAKVKVFVPLACTLVAAVPRLVTGPESVTVVEVVDTT